MKKILIISDLHVGSLWGLWPPKFRTTDSRTGDKIEFVPNKTQKGLWNHWKRMLAEVPDPECNHGRGATVSGLYWINICCPLHGKEKVKEE